MIYEDRLFMCSADRIQTTTKINCSTEKLDDDDDDDDDDDYGDDYLGK
jgi:hypothetical protein